MKAGLAAARPRWESMQEPCQPRDHAGPGRGRMIYWDNLLYNSLPRVCPTAVSGRSDDSLPPPARGFDAEPHLIAAHFYDRDFSRAFRGTRITERDNFIRDDFINFTGGNEHGECLPKRANVCLLSYINYAK